ncbi:MAG: energy-coupling factor transporter transmembrane component T family protein [Rudaea sp.]
MSRTFFLGRASGLHALHPLTKLTLAAAVVWVGFLAHSPLVPLGLFAFVIVPFAAFGRIAGSLLRVTLAILILLGLSLVIVQGLFYPGATRVLLPLGPFALKEEGLVFAFGTLSRIMLLTGAGLLLLFSTHPGDLMLALTQRGLPSSLAYIVVTALQLIPQMQARAAAIVDAQRSRGLETDGSLLLRLRGVIPLLGPLVIGAIADVDERAMALEARAFARPGPKTSYKWLADTRAQRLARYSLLIAALVLGALEIAGVGL